LELVLETLTNDYFSDEIRELKMKTTCQGKLTGKVWILSHHTDKILCICSQEILQPYMRSRKAVIAFTQAIKRN
jgi:hypothetical protein